MQNLLKILTKLISFASITPFDKGCQEYMIAELEALNFDCQRMNKAPVSNFFAKYGNQKPLLVFAGHTDVVPIGDAKRWLTDPFQLEEKNGILYGRGVADMKGSLAAMLMMAERFVKKYPHFEGSLGFLITSGEEGNEYDKGTPYIMHQLKQQEMIPDYCIVGEPSSSKEVGDVLKIGRRGSLSGTLTLQGKQGHVAYPHLAINPIHSISPIIHKLTTTCWDKGNEFFPPTTFQITEIQAGGEANNIIPGTLKLTFNFRYSTEQTAEKLQQKVNQYFAQYDLLPEISWHLSGEPFLTAQGNLLTQTQKAIFQHKKLNPELSTSGGTSDGRFISPYGVEVVELGPVNATIHQLNESLSLKDLEILTDIYFTICENIFIKNI